ncbi:IS5 family transposase [Legionella israelensis]|uniref:IS5 family transposase n=1 Tax=Legionella israelensis TaxID=454 RepID=A0AAX1EIX6_9GAMM|nr:IS5 family transposase [Legionella israelensis]
MLTDEEWNKIKDCLPGKAGDPGRSGTNNRLFIEGIMWMAQNGARWRALPKEYGKWSTVHKRFICWSKRGIWQMIFNILAVDADTEWLMIDSTVIRAHQHASGAKRGQENQALGRSKGGFSTKIHALCDALGNPLKFILTPGQTSDYTQALPLLEGLTTTAILADKEYDADYIINAATDMNAVAIIPPKANRKAQREYDKEIYKERNLIERMFNKLKHFRRVATRYDKLAQSFLSFVYIAATALWLR